MAELLILNKDNRTGDAALDAGRYRRGDVVAVMEDGHAWGRLEGPPDFVKVRITGVPADKLRDLLDHDTSDVLDVEGQPIMRGRRKVRLALADLTTNQRQRLLAGETLEFTQTQVRNAVKA